MCALKPTSHLECKATLKLIYTALNTRGKIKNFQKLYLITCKTLNVQTITSHYLLDILFIELSV